MLKKSALSCRYFNSPKLKFLARDRLNVVKPGVVKLLRPTLAWAPGPVTTYLEAKFTGRYPIAGKKVPPFGSDGSKHAPPDETPVGVAKAPGPPLDRPTAPPGSSPNANTSEPVRVVAKGFREARSPAESPLPFESSPD